MEPAVGIGRAQLGQAAEGLVVDDDLREGHEAGPARELGSTVRAFVAEAPRESALASRGREFWADRFAADRQLVQRAIARGELPADADPDLVIEALLGPLYLRLLITGQPLDMAFSERVVDLLLAGLLRVGDADGGDRT